MFGKSVTRAIRWFGGKSSDLDFIIEYFPLDAHHFVDVFGGSAAVILNAGPYKRETYNDIDPVLVNLFRVMKESTSEFRRAVELTPYSREEFVLAGNYMSEDSEIELARKTYIRCNQSVRGKHLYAGYSDWGFDKKRKERKIKLPSCL